MWFLWKSSEKPTVPQSPPVHSWRQIYMPCVWEEFCESLITQCSQKRQTRSECLKTFPIKQYPVLSWGPFLSSDMRNNLGLLQVSLWPTVFYIGIWWTESQNKWNIVYFWSLCSCLIVSFVQNKKKGGLELQSQNKSNIMVW